MKPTAHYWLFGSLLSMTLLWLCLFGSELWHALTAHNASMGESPITSEPSAPTSPLLNSSGSLGSLDPANSATGTRDVTDTTSPPAGIVIIMDDMGENLTAAQEVLRLPFPVVLSIWPHSSHARQTAEMAHGAGREVFIHLPMQALGPPRKDVGENLIMQGDSEQRMTALVQDAQRRVPHAIGINNHMGSRVTTHNPTVSVLCKVLTPTGLVILDSKTHQASVLYTAACKRSLPALQRHIFLDHKQDRASVVAQLEKARHMAKERVVVVIGHPHAVTIQALRQWGPPPDVTVLSVRQALPKIVR